MGHKASKHHRAYHRRTVCNCASRVIRKLICWMACFWTVWRRGSRRFHDLRFDPDVFFAKSEADAANLIATKAESDFGTVRRDL